MRCLIQRVCCASVEVNGHEVARIGEGLLLLTGIAEQDKESDLDWMVQKVLNMRIFSSKGENKMSYSLQDIAGQLLVVSQFTLFASTKKGNRPSFTSAANSEKARSYFDAFLERLKKQLAPQAVQSGIFASHMQVSLTNDGPVTIFVDSRQ